MRLTKLRFIAAVAALLAGLSCAGSTGSSRRAPGGLEPRTSPVQVGEEAPDFTLDDQNGRKVTLSSARGAAPVVLVFYRGHW